MKKAVVTDHSIKRTKSKLGISKKLADKNAQKALAFGITHAEAKNGLKKFLDKLYLSNGAANNVRVYHHYVYLFHGSTLITIINLPRNLCKLSDQIQKQKENDCDKA